jgi:predicted flap endonuclease-1-like 5' DNA nuclease
MTELKKIEGIGETFGKKLAEIEVTSVESLLQMGATPQGRRMIEDKTGISHDQVLEWVNHADLFRIKGIGEEYSDLLEEAGVDTVAELAHRNAENLVAKLKEVNEAKDLVRRLPTLKEVTSWIEQARTLPKIISY